MEPPLVIVAGGDGTVNAVVNSLTPGMATLAVLPLGTSNVLAAELGICSVEDGVQRILNGATRPLSVGVLETDTACHRFVLMAGIGFDGAVVRDVRPMAKRLLKKGAYALSAALSTMKWDTSLMDVVTPERTIACHSAIVCNASRYGGSSILAPRSELFSPEFSVVCIRKNLRRTYLRLAVDLLSGRFDSSRDIIRIPADRVEIRGTKPIQIDGDFIGYSPATLETMSDFARIIV
jgi:diacylglycerol kinase family enzyme